MIRALPIFGAAVVVCAIAHAQPPQASASAAPPASDVVFWRNGKEQPGRVVSYDTRKLRLEVLLAPGQPPASVSIPMTDIARIEFAPNPAEAALLESKELARAPALVAAWNQRKPLLALPSSNAGEFAIAAANVLLSSTATPSREEACRLFQAVETADWNDDRRAVARRGRLRAMIALGKGAEAVAEARQIANAAEDPAVSIEANLVLGDAAFAQLKKLEEDNPRWREDVNVRPERQRLLHEALDHLLYPALFHGSEQEAAAKGLSRAIEVCRFDNRTAEAIELAKDIAELYPNSPETQAASQFLTSNPSASKDNEEP